MSVGLQAASVGLSGQQGAQNPTGHDAFRDVDLNVFLKLLITELQNQDPMNPMDNHQMLQQISQIREIESNARLTETLEAVLMGENLSTASSMIDRLIMGLSEDGQVVAGRVERVSVVDGEPKLHVGEHLIRLKNVSEISAAEGGSEPDN